MKEMPVPHDLQIELHDDQAAGAAFEALSQDRRAEFIDWILSARSPASRARRVEETVRLVRGGERLDVRRDDPHGGRWP